MFNKTPLDYARDKNHQRVIIYLDNQSTDDSL